MFRWLSSTFVNRKGTLLGEKKGEMLTVLRQVLSNTRDLLKSN
jgi:hypothetical protein